MPNNAPQLDQEKFGQIVLFEDWSAQNRPFLPLCYTHAVAELRVGALTQLERLKLVAGNIPIILDVRESRKELAQERSGLIVNELPEASSTLFLNARAFLDAALIAEINAMTISGASGSQLVQGKTKVAALAKNPKRLDSEWMIDFNRERFVTEFKLDNSHSTDAKVFAGLWEMIHFNWTAIMHDAALLRASLSTFASLSSSYQHVFGDPAENVLIGENVTIAPGVVLDASAGPIMILNGAKIMANAVIVGPAVIGENALVKIGAKIYEGTTIGPNCKVGGEVESSIMLGFSNKQHDGYLGHSYLGQWVNLGADTNTSDLKNDYSLVKLEIESQEFATNSLFVGLLMGDHSKSAINTQFNTGTVVGVSCNVFDGGFPPKWIPNFSWGGSSGFEKYRIDKAIEVAKIVMARRNKVLSLIEEKLLRELAKNEKRTSAE